MNKVLTALVLSGLTTVVSAHEVAVLVYNTQSTAGRPAYISSLNKARIVNHTDAAQTYRIFATLCADNAGCSEPWRAKVTLPPHAEKTIQTPLYVNHVFRFSGTFRATGSMEVMGETSASKTSYGTITVY